MVSENNGLFSAQREIVIEAAGAQFVGNDPNDNSHMVHSFSSDVSLTQPGDISMNNFGSAFLSGAGTVRLNDLAGNVTANTGTSFMRGNDVIFSSEGGSRSIKDNTSVQFFVGTESVIATARDGMPLPPPLASLHAPRTHPTPQDKTAVLHKRACDSFPLSPF